MKRFLREPAGGTVFGQPGGGYQLLYTALSMHIRRNSQLVASTSPAVAIDDSELGKNVLLDDGSNQPADLQGVVKIPTDESLEAAEKDANADTTLGNRGAGADADASSDANAGAGADADAGEVVPHRLEDATPSRPTPIKDQDVDADTEYPDNAPEDAGNEDWEAISADGQDDHIGGYPEHQSDSDDEWFDAADPEEMQLVEVGGFGGVPLGMLGPVVDAPGSDEADTGIMEIEILPPNAPEMLMTGGSGDGMIEEIWISGDNRQSSHGVGNGGFGFGLDNLADEIEEIMEGLTGTIVKDPAQISGGQDAMQSMPTAAAPTDVARVGQEDVAKGWAALGSIMEAVLGLCAAIFVSKMRARRRGYREVQERLNDDEDWS
ncbi:hypothetical protein Dda_3387 [Drechslerella dactyloides]|uniref:Uncharacterized protein n=1 Tax=Drechslerella dactyloides TaxID=74499 RepID=A0AAD6J5M8_DREDA|nr:hypothetical protein Dda_3387 [Drechslerella dactyloides]